MINKRQVGAIGEELATKYLIYKNYKILERNYYCRYGEIDIIAKKNNEIIFIEVKSRSDIYFGRPCQAVNKAKMKHIWLCAMNYLKQKNMMQKTVRFDVVEILFEKNIYKINHIKQII